MNTEPWVTAIDAARDLDVVKDTVYRLREHKLKKMNVPILIADSSWYNMSRARLAGIRTHYGEISPSTQKWSWN